MNDSVSLGISYPVYKKKNIFIQQKQAKKNIFIQQKQARFVEIRLFHQRASEVCRVQIILPAVNLKNRGNGGATIWK